RRAEDPRPGRDHSAPLQRPEHGRGPAPHVAGPVPALHYRHGVHVRRLAVALLLVALSAHAQERRAEAARLMNELMTGKAPVGAPFALPDARGRLRKLEEFRGRLVLL